MDLRSDFTKVVQVAFDPAGFQASPAGGVARFMLDRLGGEVARATSIVRFAPGATFSAHRHGGGEEFLVLDGVFSDAFGDFGAGSYVRNPIGSSHTPGSKGGCTILVKLWQMNPLEQTATRLTAEIVTARAAIGAPLYEDANERVSLLTVEPGQSVDLNWPQGGEMFVLEGEVEVSGAAKARIAPWGWLRLPASDACAQLRPVQSARSVRSVRLWLKQLKSDRSYEAWALR